MPRSFQLLLLFLLSHSVVGQVITPNGSFDKDSLKLGEEVTYSLSISYPKSIDVIFPDSLHNFQPFELVRRESFPTVSDSLFSFDSAVYVLTTFELDTIQTLDLPVYMVTSGDSIAVSGGRDSIILQHVVTVIPDSIALKQNTAFSDVGLAFNYPYALVGTAGVVIVATVLFLVFGKTVRKRIRLYRLRRLHRRFSEPFLQDINGLQTRPDVQTVEILLARWKRYLERLESFPYTKLTSPEIVRHYGDTDLLESLQRIDRFIYGGVVTSALSDSFKQLRRVSEMLFDQRIEEIQNG